MNTKLTMTVAALFLAAIGITLSFAPDVVMKQLGLENAAVFAVLFQLLGAMYYAFAMLNWMAKGALIGGIYNKPIAIANFTHFLIGGITLSKAVFSQSQLPLALSGLAVIYVAFAVMFWFIMSRHPQPAK